MKRQKPTLKQAPKVIATRSGATKNSVPSKATFFCRSCEDGSLRPGLCWSRIYLIGPQQPAAPCGAVGDSGQRESATRAGQCDTSGAGRGCLRRWTAAGGQGEARQASKNQTGIARKKRRSHVTSCPKNSIFFGPAFVTRLLTPRSQKSGMGFFWGVDKLIRTRSWTF